MSHGHSSMDSDVYRGSAAISEASGNLPQSGAEENRGSVQRISAALRSLLLFGIAYVLACKYSSGFSASAPAPLWLPDSVLLSALLLTPRKRWLWFFLIGLPIRWMTLNAPLWLLVSTYVNDCLKAVLSVYLLRRLIPGPVRLNSLRQFWIYIGTAVVGAPILSALAGAATHRPLGETFLPAFSRWFLGDATAALVLTPTLLYWCLDGWRELKEDGIYFAALVLAVVACLYFTFLVPHANYPTIALYAPVPFLILAATRFKPVGVSTTISLLALVSILSAGQERGAFFATHAQDPVLSIQLFLIVISIPMLFVAILIEERGIAEKDLRKSRKDLQENFRRNQDLAGRLLSAQEDERKRIARELHDDIGQRLALLSVSSDALLGSIPAELEKERALALTLMSDLQSLCSDVQSISHQLHSSSLQHLGLEGALGNLCRAVAQQHHVTVGFHSDDVAGLPAETALCLFRVAQEALNNAVKHGKATQIDVAVAKQGDRLHLKVSDTGTGFDTTHLFSGLGLVSMRERLRFLGGNVAVKSQPGLGTEIEAELPLRKVA
jgi:signal transduction histidine kinase